jgi:hypothetical protein
MDGLTLLQRLSLQMKRPAIRAVTSSINVSNHRSVPSRPDTDDARNIRRTVEPRVSILTQPPDGMEPLGIETGTAARCPLKPVSHLRQETIQ